MVAKVGLQQAHFSKYCVWPLSLTHIIKKDNQTRLLSFNPYVLPIFY